MKFASFIWFLSLDIDRPPIKGSTSPHLSFNSANVGQISVKIPQFLDSGGRPVCNILVATQPLVSVWELLMGVGKMGKLPILLPRRLSPSVSEGKGVSWWKGHFGEERRWALLAFWSAGTGVSAHCEKGWTVTKERFWLLSGCWSRLRRRSKNWGCGCGSFLPCQATCWMREGQGEEGVRRRVCRGYLCAM